MATESKERIKTLIENSQYLCLFIVLVGMFMGTMYAFGASFLLSIPVSFGLVFLMNYIIDILISLRKETKASASSMNLGAGTWWIIYIIVALPISYYTIHMFNVEFGELNATREIGKKKNEFISQWKKNVDDSIENGFANKVDDTYTDYLNYKSGRITVDVVALNSGLTVGRVENITGSTPQAKKDNINSAFQSRRDSLEHSTNACFNIDPLCIDKLNKHDFKQNSVLESLDSTLTKMLQLKKFQNQVPGVYFDVPSDEEVNTVLNYSSSINKPTELLKKNLLASLVYMLIINLIILLPVLLSERRKAPPKSNKINSVTTH